MAPSDRSVSGSTGQVDGDLHTQDETDRTRQVRLVMPCNVSVLCSIYGIVIIRGYPKISY